MCASSGTLHLGFAPYLCCCLLNHFDCIDCRACPGSAHFCPQNYQFTCKDLDLHCFHPSPHPKRCLLWFSWFCTAHGRESLYVTVGRLIPSQDCPFTYGISDLDSRLIRVFLDQPESTPKQHDDQFSRYCRAHDCNRLTDHASPPVAVGDI